MSSASFTAHPPANEHPFSRPPIGRDHSNGGGTISRRPTGMKSRSIIIVAGIVIFLGVVGYALLREVEREESSLATSISGRVEVSRQLLASGQADILRTDRLVLILVDPRTGEAAAVRTETPVSPPQTIVIGQQDARDGRVLYGAYTLIIFTDKDGDMYRVTPGEVFGRSPHPIELGTEGILLMMDEPFRGQVPPASKETVPRGSP